MEKLLRVEHSVGDALCVCRYYLAKKVVCGVSPAEKAVVSSKDDRIMSKVGLYEALAPRGVHMRTQKLWLHRMG